ncbi:pyruvate, phosphate dikinase [Nocardia carnea]|uniref:pyruvate, phosphate dikinase n=1 Tax=Nocardia carnea TaxID=37328 RepID=UPI0024583295|nr:pyruvate, phosphate dikinase [Nocardia carnea]
MITAPVRVLDGTTGLDRDVLGGKGFSIERMRALDIPVPPALVLTTQVCRAYYADRTGELPVGAWAQLLDTMSCLEQATGRTFGGGERPLLVSVRSGAATSMPGMMDTILNLGMTDEVQAALAFAGGEEYAADTRRRFDEQFLKVTGVAAPSDPWEQLHVAAIAVLDSWQSRRAIHYRRERGISGDGGTAVIVQAMVFGNLDDRSGTGVLFSRNPLDGEPEPYGEWLPRGQGEDVVSGRADALPLSALRESMPEVHKQLLVAAARLEQRDRDVQDIEFTVENGHLWLLQSRAAKRSPTAAVRHACQLGREGLLTVSEALDRISSDHVRSMLVPHLDPAEASASKVVADGKPACSGIATGIVVVDTYEAEARAEAGEDVVLARPTTDPDDVAAMSVVRAVLTELGGSTSHAAVVCREMNVPCIVGTGIDTLAALAGTTVTVDASTGHVYAGTIARTAVNEHDDSDLAQITEWLRGEAGTAIEGNLLELLETRTRGRKR